MEKEQKTIRSMQRILKFENSKLDDIKLRISRILSSIQECQKKIEIIEQKLHYEKNIASQDIELKKTFGAFAQRLNLEKDELNQEINKLNQQKEILLQEFKEVSATVKGYEKIISAKQTMIQKHLDRIEQHNLDEISIRNFNDIYRAKTNLNDKH
jgi:flagellar export protein FliJ